MDRIVFNDFNDNSVKIGLLKLIVKIIDDNKWNQATAANVLGVDQPKISQIKNGRVAGFSLERLLSFLIKLNCAVELVISRCN